MSLQSEFFLAALRSSVQIETLEISHPSFSKVYRIVRNARRGVTVTLEDASVRFFEYVPTQITNLGSRDDLDTGIRVAFGDLGETLPKEIDRVDIDDAWQTVPICKYRTFDSADLTNVLAGPYVFEIKTITGSPSGATFEAKAPRLNYSKTGEIYKLDRFPMMRGFL